MAMLSMGCTAQSQFLESRNFRGCYRVEGMIASNVGVGVQLNANGYMMSGEATVDDCVKLIEVMKGGL